MSYPSIGKNLTTKKAIDPSCTRAGCFEIVCEVGDYQQDDGICLRP